MKSSAPRPPRPPTGSLPVGPSRYALLLALLPGAAGCSSQGPAEGMRGPGGPVPVTVATVARRDVPLEARTVGTAESVATVEIMPQVGGLMQAVHFREGDFVKKGDLLFTIDTRPYQATLSAAQAELERNRALSEEAKKQVERFEKLVAEGVGTQAELGEKRATAAAFEATLGANRAAIQSNSINLQFAAIRSPIDGRTGSLLVQAGNVVKATEQRPLVVIRAIEPIYVRFSVPEQHLSTVRALMAKGPVTVEAKPRGAGTAATAGELTFIENAVDPTTGKIDMKARFRNEGQAFWPGQFVDVVLRLGVEPDALVVPEAAVQTSQEGAYTFVIGVDGKASLRRLDVERTIGGETVVASGITAGERVVTDGQVRLKQGASVEIKSPQAPGASSVATSANGAPPPGAPAR